MRGTAISKTKILNAKIFTAENIMIFLLVASIFLLTFYMRMAISSELAYINTIYYISILCLMIKIGYQFSIVGLLGFAVLSIQFYIIESTAEIEAQSIIKYFILYCAPIFVCQISLGKKNQDKVILAKQIIKCINVFTILVFIILIIDCITGSSVMKMLTNGFMTDIKPWVSSNILDRHASIWGHYLSTAGFYLVFYYLNIAYYKTQGEYILDIRVVNIIATIGILSTGGKTALVVFLISLIWLNITGAHAIRNAVALTLFLGILYLFGAFDIVLERFGAEDLSSGRNESAALVLSKELPRIFEGYGENYMMHMTASIDYGIVSMFSEYSLLALMYKFGVVFVILMIFLILRAPFVAARTSGKVSLAFMAVMMLLYFSTFNGMVGLPDTYLLMSLYCLCMPLLQGVHQKVRKEKNSGR